MEKVPEIFEVGSCDLTIEKCVHQDLAKKDDKSSEKMRQLLEGSGTSFGEKKRRRRKLDDTTFMDNETDNKEGTKTDDQIGGNSWQNSNDGYTYKQLAGRVFKMLKENNPELAGGRRKAVLQVPQVLKEGSKKTVLVNFMNICKSMHRQPDHVMAFFLAEAGTTGNLDGQQRLIIKCKLEAKNFENFIRSYTTEYVICKGCKSLNTILSKEARLFFLRCEQCGSCRTVAAMKSGYVAPVGPRTQR